MAHRASSSVKSGELVVLFLVAAGPLLMGSVHPPIASAESALAVLALLAIARPGAGHAYIHRVPWALAALGSIVLIAMIQSIPLPPAVLAVLSPDASLLWRNMDALAGRPDSWHPLSVDPPATAFAMMRMAGLWAVAMVSYSAAKKSGRHALRKLAWTLVGSGIASVVLGAFFYLVTPGTLLGFYVPDGLDRLEPAFRATFVNANHQAAFLGFSALCAIGLATEGRGRGRTAALVAFLALCSALILTMSRMAVLAFGAGLFVLLATSMTVGKRRDRPRKTARLVTAGFLVMFIVFSLLTPGDPLGPDLAGALHEAAASLSLKLNVLGAAVRMAWVYPFTGVGAGAFGAVFARFNDATPHLVFPYLENEPLELLAEIGLPAGTLVLAVLAAFWFLGLARRLRDPLLAGPIMALAALAMHNLADFSLSMNGLAIPAAAVLGSLAGVNGRDADRPGRTGVPVSRKCLFATALGAAVVVLAALAMPHGPSAWWGRTLRELPRSRAGLAWIQEATGEHPADFRPYMAAADILQELHGAAEARPWVEAASMRAPFLFVTDDLVIRDLLLRGRAEQARRLLDRARRFYHRWPLESYFRIYALPRVRARMVLLAPLPDTGRSKTMELADFFRKQGRDDLVEALLARALDGIPADPVFAGRLADLYMERGDFARAEELGARVMAAHPDSKQGYRILGMAAMKRKDYYAALHMLLEAVRLDPDDADLVGLSARAALKARDYGMFDKLVERFKRLCGKGPRCAKIWELVSRREQAKGRWQKAAAAMEEASRLAPGDASIAIRAAHVLKQAGEPGRAVILLRKFIARNPGARSAREALARILGEAHVPPGPGR